jgi:hypothetical protein
MYLPCAIFVANRGLSAFQLRSAEGTEPAHRTSGLRVQKLDHLLPNGLPFVVRIAMNRGWLSRGRMDAHFPHVALFVHRLPGFISLCGFQLYCLVADGAVKEFGSERKI